MCPWPPEQRLYYHPTWENIPHDTWQETLSAREEALRNRHLREAERLSGHTKRLLPHTVGDHVRIQNQTGPRSLKWDKTRTVIAVRQFDQYAIRSTVKQSYNSKIHTGQTPPLKMTLDQGIRFTAYEPGLITSSRPNTGINTQSFQFKQTDSSPSPSSTPKR